MSALAPAQIWWTAAEIAEAGLPDLPATKRRVNAMAERLSQIDITVEAAGEDPRAVEMADMVRDWLTRDELADEVFDILDCIGKGVSFTEIIWDTSEGQWRPERLEYRDPRWFRFARQDLATPMKLDEHGQEVPLDAFKFIFAGIRAKSGLPLRSGLSRVAAWGWMFKAFTQRDWAIFTQTYGQPLRVGKWGAGATEEDKDTLFRAVANIAGDCAAIIPESMTIDFVETKNIGSTADLYEKRADWLDRQISKAVLGQTATTDAVTGGLGSGREHRQVQEDIERADAKALSAILNRDLIRPWIDLEYGPQAKYPRIRIGRPEEEDLKLAADALGVLVPLGLRVSMTEVRDKFGWSDPAPDNEILSSAASSAPAPDLAGTPPGQTSPIKRFSGPIKRGLPSPGTVTAPQAEGASAANSGAPDPAAVLAGTLAAAADPAMGRMIGQIEAMLVAAGSLSEFRAMLLAAFPDIDAAELVDVMAAALTSAFVGGRVALAEESGD